MKIKFKKNYYNLGLYFSGIIRFDNSIKGYYLNIFKYRIALYYQYQLIEKGSKIIIKKWNKN